MQSINALCLVSSSFSCLIFFLLLITPHSYLGPLISAIFTFFSDLLSVLPLLSTLCFVSSLLILSFLFFILFFFISATFTCFSPLLFLLPLLLLFSLHYVSSFLISFVYFYFFFFLFFYYSAHPSKHSHRFMLHPFFP